VQTPTPQQPHDVPADPPGIRVEADRETAARFQRHPGPQRGSGYAYRVIEDGYEALRGLVEDKEDRDERKSLRDEATAALAEEYARPVIDQPKDRDRHKDRDR